MCDTEQSPIDARVIAIDKMEYYNLPSNQAEYIKTIRSVYLYDHNQHTFCCELTPSYRLIHLYNSVNLTEKGLELPDDERGELYDQYESESGDDIYMHCRTVDRLSEKGGNNDYFVYGETGESYDDTDYDDQIEEILQDVLSNLPF